MPLVDLRGLGKTYMPSPPMMRILLRSAIKSPVEALKDVTLQVRAGEICAIVGPNGAGKTTLFRILTGLIAPTTGVGYIRGHDVDHESFQVRRIIGFHPSDERSLLGRHSCRENLMFYGRLHGMPPRVLERRTREILELVGLGRAAGRLAIALSSGMRARLQLARALLHNPQVLILDEPTGSLDPVAAHEFLEIVKETTVEQGVATLISSHRLEEIEALPEHVLLLHEGDVVFDGHLDALRGVWEEPRLEIRFGSTASASVAARYLIESPEIEVLSSAGEVLTISTGLRVSDLFAVANGQLDGVTAISEVRIPLRDLLATILRPSGGAR